MKVIGLIALKDREAFQEYRDRVAATIEKHAGRIVFRGAMGELFWNELSMPAIDAIVEIDFPSRRHAIEWARDPDYLALVPVRSRAMNLTLLGIDVA